MGVRVYVGKLARDTTRRDLERLFRGYGRLEEATVKNGFGFVEFADRRDAEDAVHDLHGTRFLGQRIIVEEAMNKRRNDRGVNRVIVKNVAPESTWQDLKDLMRKAGRVTFADILKDRDGEGVVEYAHREDMKYALRELENARLNGQRITLIEAGRRRKSSRSRSRSRSPADSRRAGGRSRSRSRSRSLERTRSDRMDEDDKDDYRSPSPRDGSNDDGGDDYDDKDKNGNDEANSNNDNEQQENDDNRSDRSDRD